MRYQSIFVVLMLAALLTACVSPNPIPPPPPPSPPPPAGTAVAQTTESITSTLPVTSTLPITSTLPSSTESITSTLPTVATTEPLTNTQRIVFAAGGGPVTLQGKLAASASDRYTLAGQAGQVLTVHLQPDSGALLSFGVYGADGTIVYEYANLLDWTGPLPTTQDYTLDVHNFGAAAASYALQVTLGEQTNQPPPATAVPVPRPVTPPTPVPQAVTVQRIRFAAGATSAAVQGYLPGGGINRWVLTAAAGQTLYVQLATNGGSAEFSLYGADGTLLVPAGTGATEYASQLPSSQDYFIDVRSTSGNTVAYTLQVTIPPLASPGPATRRIQFAQGASSATVDGQLNGHAVDRWVVRAGAGQTMSVLLSSTTGKAILAIWGADGTVLISDHPGATQWSGPLPSTQDYNIDVINTDTSQSGYTLQVTIPPLTSPGPTTRRIQFAPGATSATVQGQLAGRNTDRWVVKAAAGQTMNVQLTYSQGQAILIIFGADGNVLISDHAGATQWSGVLPTTQDYNIDVRGVVDGSTVYTLKVTIPPLPNPNPTTRRLQFAPGSSSGTVHGQLAGRNTDRWVVKAAAGQTMNVQLTYSQGQAILIIFGADGNVLISDHAGATQWSGVLPTTQDYNIDVRGVVDGSTAYTLKVSIPPLPTGGTTTRRLQFGRGATSATVAGHVGSGTDRWLVKAGAGQTMTVKLTPSGGDAVLIIFGADGNVLLSDHAGATQWSGVLPRTQDYNIDVRGAGAGADYTLQVTIPPL